MDDSPLGRLPAELRNRIYEFALIEPHGIVLDTEHKPVAARSHHRHCGLDYAEYQELRLPSPGTAMRVCRQMREETKLLYFSVNKLVLQTWYCNRHGSSRQWLDALAKWADMVGPKQVERIRSVEVMLGDPYSNPDGLAIYWDELSQAKSLFHSDAELDFTLWVEVDGDENHFSVAELTLPFGRAIEAGEHIKKQVERINAAPKFASLATPLEVERLERWYACMRPMPDAEHNA